MRSTVMLDAAVAIRRRQFDPQLRTVAGAQRNGEERQQQRSKDCVSVPSSI